MLSTPIRERKFSMGLKRVQITDNLLATVLNDIIRTGDVRAFEDLKHRAQYKGQPLAVDATSATSASTFNSTPASMKVHGIGGGRLGGGPGLNRFGGGGGRRMLARLCIILYAATDNFWSSFQIEPLLRDH